MDIPAPIPLLYFSIYIYIYSPVLNSALILATGIDTDIAGVVCGIGVRREIGS
jgi:hypothetical protein